MPSITSDLLVDDVMRRWPETIRVFMNAKFMCVGCPIGVFHTVDDACREHHANRERFLGALEQAAQGIEASLEAAAP